MRKSRARRTRAMPTVWSATNAPLSSKRSAAATEFSAMARVGSRFIRSRPPTRQIWSWYICPRNDLLIEADHISPRDGEVRPGPRVNEFVQELDKLNLDVATIVGIHGDQASLEATRTAAKK